MYYDFAKQYHGETNTLATTYYKLLPNFYFSRQKSEKKSINIFKGPLHWLTSLK